MFLYTPIFWSFFIERGENIPIGESSNTNLVMRLIGDRRIELEDFILKVIQEPFYSFETNEQVSKIFSKFTDKFLRNLSEEELLDLRSYTGYNFKRINAILRNNWTYEEHGLLSNDVREKYEHLSKNIQCILNKYVSPQVNFTTY